MTFLRSKPVEGCPQPDSREMSPGALVYVPQPCADATAPQAHQTNVNQKGAIMGTVTQLRIRPAHPRPAPACRIPCNPREPERRYTQREVDHEVTACVCMALAGAIVLFISLLSLLGIHP